MANKPKLAVGGCVAGLFDDAVSSCVHTASNVKIFNVQGPAEIPDDLVTQL
jgi:hypothetical protein